ncbi:hypothetical protein B296_00018979 [Ensete ventricosum]|uniref:Uncharacterized protein n=1 Tax=Ensete ventricosum TaxID=4639 RepID=A0A427B394_ENSVE|nr:hypothetical protein B296_00018979 [Ensete ventricosum]
MEEEGRRKKRRRGIVRIGRERERGGEREARGKERRTRWDEATRVGLVTACHSRCGNRTVGGVKPPPHAYSYSRRSSIGRCLRVARDGTPFRSQTSIMIGGYNPHVGPMCGPTASEDR